MSNLILANIPPQNLEAEQAALGAMLLEKDAIARAVELLRLEDFYRESHRIIFEGVIALFKRHEQVDLITLGNWLKERDQLESIGGTLYLTTIMSQVPTAAGIAIYCELIKKCSIRRQVIRAADEAMLVAYNGEIENDAMLATIGQRFDAITGQTNRQNDTVLLRDVQKEVFFAIDKSLDDGVSVGIKTGWHGLNRILAPLAPSNLTIVMARTKMGKTAWAMDLALDWARWELPGTIFSMEMSKEELAMRALLSETEYEKADFDDIEACRNDPARMTELAKAVERQWELPIAINDRPAMMLSEIDAIIREQKHKYGIKWAMVDYLQLAHADRQMTKTEEVNAVAQGLKNIAKAHGIHIILLSQLGREIEKESPHRPKTHHLLYGGEAAVDTLISLYWPGFYGVDEMRAAKLDPELHQNIVEVGVLLQRGGQSNNRTYLVFEARSHRFRDLNPDEWRSMHGRGNLDEEAERETARQAQGY